MVFGFVNVVNVAHSVGFGLDGFIGNNFFDLIGFVVGVVLKVKFFIDVLGDF